MPLFSAEQAMHLKHQKVGFTILNRVARSYIFLHFINPVTIYIGDKEINTSSNACIIFTPGSNLHYSAQKIRMLHNFLHFNTNDESFFEKFNIPVNKVFYTNLQNEIVALSGASTMPAVNFTTLGLLRIVLPHSLAEQQKIAECLSTLDEQIKAESAELDALKEHKKGLMQQLFPQPTK